MDTSGSGIRPDIFIEADDRIGRVQAYPRWGSGKGGQREETESINARRLGEERV